MKKSFSLSVLLPAMCLLNICSLTVFTSCTRGINIETIDAMGNGAAKDSARLYYYLGLRQGDWVTVEKSTRPEMNLLHDSLTPHYLTTTPEIKRDKNLKVLNRVCQVFRGDTLQIVGDYKREVAREKFMQKTGYSNCIKVKAIKNGKIAGEGWCYADCFNPLPHNWAIIFYQPVDVLALLFIFGGIIVVFYLLWKLVYWLIVDKIRKKECFWQERKIYFKAVYLIMSLLVGLMIFYVNFNEELVYSLKFNPDFFAHFSEYPFLLKLLPLVSLLWIGSATGMCIEMIKKFRTLWLIIYFPGTWSIGFLLITLVFAASWLIYIILPTVAVFIIMMFAGKADDATGGILSKGGNSGKKIVGYNAQGQAIREGDGGAIASRTWSEHVDKNQGIL